MQAPTPEPAGPDCPPRLSDQLCFTTYAAAHAFARVYKPMLDRLGLTYPQYLAMLVLWERDDVTVKEIGGRLHLDSGTLTPLLKRLEAAGLVTRRRDAQDERQVRIGLTDKGRSLRGSANDVFREVGCATGLAEGEIAALKRRIDQLRESLDAFAGR